MTGACDKHVDMYKTCAYLNAMKMIQLRNVPDALHRRLKARAALEGKSLSDYLLQQVQTAAERPTVAELRERLAARTQPKLSVSPAEVLREERDGR